MYGAGLFIVCLILLLFKLLFGNYVLVFMIMLLCYLFQFKWHLLGASLDLIGLLASLKLQTKNVHNMKSWGVIDIFEDALRRYPTKPMMIMADTGESVTYQEMDERSNKVGKYLLEKGIQQGSTVLASNCYHWNFFLCKYCDNASMLLFKKSYCSFFFFSFFSLFSVNTNSQVALLMPNSIDYVATWLGIAKIGCHTALLNTNLSGVPLVHAIRTGLLSY
jgi:acyl-CoA synthetase (AMP-forming)/AMP-acid ligase II